MQHLRLHLWFRNRIDARRARKETIRSLHQKPRMPKVLRKTDRKHGSQWFRSVACASIPGQRFALAVASPATVPYFANSSTSRSIKRRASSLRPNSSSKNIGVFLEIGLGREHYNLAEDIREGLPRYVILANDMIELPIEPNFDHDVGGR